MAITKDVMMGKTPRKSFAKQDQILELPNMLKIQKDSYEWFLREGLREVFKDVATITDYTGNLEHIGDRQHIIMLGKALAQSLAEHHVLGYCHMDSSQPFLFGSM